MACSGTLMANNNKIINISNTQSHELFFLGIASLLINKKTAEQMCFNHLILIHICAARM